MFEYEGFLLLSHLKFLSHDFPLYLPFKEDKMMYCFLKELKKKKKKNKMIASSELRQKERKNCKYKFRLIWAASFQ